MRRLTLSISLLLLLAGAHPALATHRSSDPVHEATGDGEELQGWDEELYDESQPAPSDPLAPAAPPVDDAWEDAPPQDWPPDELEPAVELVTTATVAGKQAMLRTDGRAAIPRGAPKRVRAIIAAANQIAGKPYKWGGGHAKLVDRGYDCSGAVGYALIRAGLQTAPMVSGQYARWGAAGAGRWLTIYANKGHVYMEIAGLRLDTSAAGYGDKGVRWRPVTGKRRGFKVRHPIGL